MREKSNNLSWLPLLLGVTAAVGMFVGYQLDEEYYDFEDSGSREISIISHPGKVDELLKFVDAKYVDQLDQATLADNTVKYILDQLDPFSSYLGPNDLVKYKEHITGEYMGIGIEFRMVHDTLSVFHVLENSPAKRKEIKAGDRILTVNGQIITGSAKDVKVAEDLVRNSGEIVTLTVLNHVGVLQTLDIHKEGIHRSSISSYYMLQDSIGYIKLDRFTTKSYSDFMLAFEDLVENFGMDDLVLDLRGNLGGVLKESIKILQQFYSKNGEMLLYTQGDNSARSEYKTHGKPFFRLDKIAVLIDNHSASASEVMAGALQDTDRGVIIGEPSYGKGLVQEHYKLRNGGELRLTVARYYTPSGRLIQKPYSSFTQLANIAEADSLYLTSKGRKVYGGGGIAPDLLQYKPLPHKQYLDSVSFERSFEIIMDQVRLLSAQSRKTADYSELSEVLFNQLVNSHHKRSKILNNNSDLIKNFFKYQLSKIYDGESIATELKNQGDPAIESALNYFNSKKSLLDYLENIPQTFESVL